MMWKNFNVIFHNNNQKNNLKNISVFNDDRTGYCRPTLEQNMDCLMQVLSQLSINEKVKCRLVCKSWRNAVDKLFSGQRHLKIVFNRSKNNFNNYHKTSNKLDPNINTLNTYIMTKQIRFQLFHQMMLYFPSIQTLVIKRLPLNDIMLLVVTNTCKQLTKLTLSSCTVKLEYYNNNYINNNNIDSDYNQITSYGWKLLINRYSHCLKQLTIKNCDLNDADCEINLVGFPQLRHLDLSDNEHLNGSALHLLGPKCDSLCLGSLNTEVWIHPILGSLSQSNPRLKRLQVKGCINQQLPQLRTLQSLVELSLMFYCPQDQTLDTLSPISNLVNLEKLTLHQERCYDEPSAIDGHSLAAIAEGCPKLRELVINGEYGWKLRLNDNNIRYLATKCQRLQHICLTGNSSEITDTSAEHLLLLARLRSVSLTSFDNITDDGLTLLIARHKELNDIVIKESSSITNRTLNAFIDVAKSEPNRQLSIYLAETSASRPKSSAEIPDNLRIIFEGNPRPRRQSEEPSAMKMMAVVGMSAVILAMIIITMLVVIIMPIGMLLMMFYENCVEYALNNSELNLNKDNPLDILWFYGTQAIRHFSELNFKTIIT